MTQAQGVARGERVLCRFLLLYNPDAQSSYRRSGRDDGRMTDAPELGGTIQQRVERSAPRESRADMLQSPTGLACHLTEFLSGERPVITYLSDFRRSVVTIVRRILGP